MSAAARWAMDSDDEVEEAEAEDDPETLQRKAEREKKAIQVLKEAEKSPQKEGKEEADTAGATPSSPLTEAERAQAAELLKEEGKGEKKTPHMKFEEETAAAKAKAEEEAARLKVEQKMPRQA